MQLTPLCPVCEGKLSDRYIINATHERSGRTCGICGRPGGLFEIEPKFRPRTAATTSSGKAARRRRSA